MLVVRSFPQDRARLTSFFIYGLASNSVAVSFPPRPY